MGRRTGMFLELGASVICIEPQAKCLEVLNKRFGKDSRVTIVGEAVGSHKGRGELSICEHAGVLATMSAKWREDGRFAGKYEWAETQEVCITTLDALIVKHGVPDFCKIDVEGYEVRVLEGLTKRIPVLSFEFTKEFLDDAERCAEHLLSMGPVEFNCSIGESMELLFPKWETRRDLFGRLQSLDDVRAWGDIYARCA